MPIQLTSPIQTGSLDSNGPYTQVKVIGVGLDVLKRRIDLICQYGNTVDGVWVGGLETVSNRSVTIKDEDETHHDFTDITANESEDAGEVYYDRESEILYQYLIDKDIFIGTIV